MIARHINGKVPSSHKKGVANFLKGTPMAHDFIESMGRYSHQVNVEYVKTKNFSIAIFKVFHVNLIVGFFRKDFRFSYGWNWGSHSQIV